MNTNAAVKVDATFVPKLAKKAASEIPECQLEILEGIGHVPHIEAPNLLFPILLEFLQGAPAGS